MVKKEDLADKVVSGPDPELYLQMLQKQINAGFDHLYLHQVGPDQAGFFVFFEREIRDQMAVPI